jgi:hypothetical protein
LGIAAIACPFPNLIRDDPKPDGTARRTREIVIPGPSPALSAMEPGIQLLVGISVPTKTEMLDSGFCPPATRAAPE